MSDTDDARAIPVRPLGAAAAGPEPSGGPPTELITHGSPEPAPAPAVPPTAVLPVVTEGQPDPYADWYAAPAPPPAAHPQASAPRAPAPVSPRSSGSPAHGGSQLPAARPGAGGVPQRARRRRPRLRAIVGALLVVLLAVLGYLVWVPWSAWQNVQRVDATPAQRPPLAKGKNFLLVGSDSREGLSAAEAEALGADTETVGKRTDTIIVVHVSDSGGQPVVVSIPRDSYVPIPGHGSNKINAAFAFGGPKLLTQTVEQATGLYLDGYLEIGFGGFASVVDSLGGVQICIERALKDRMTGLDLPAGCHTMDGKTALAYVRSRYSDPRGDLGRAERQRQFLAAVTKKAASLDTLISPGRYSTFCQAAGRGVVVGTTVSPSDGVAVLRALRAVGSGEGISTQVPVENPAYQTKNAGVAVKWSDAGAKAMFGALRADQPLSVPPGG